MAKVTREREREGRSRGAADAQNRQLYGEEGQFNPRVARAEKKRARKGRGASVGGSASAGGGEDYDFDEAFGGEGMEE